MAQKIPKFLHRYFWEVKPHTIDLATHRRYVIERLLEFGDEKAVQWMRKTFSEAELREALKTTRALNQRSATFWASVLNVDPKDVVCLSKQFLERRAGHWIS